MKMLKIEKQQPPRWGWGHQNRIKTRVRITWRCGGGGTVAVGEKESVSQLGRRLFHCAYVTSRCRRRWQLHPFYLFINNKKKLFLYNKIK